MLTSQALSVVRSTDYQQPALVMATGTMRWRGSGPVSGGSHGFPSMPLGLTADDVRDGNVRVVATSPSGRTQLMDVVDVDGMYNTNFTPDEVGELQLRMLVSNYGIAKC